MMSHYSCRNLVTSSSRLSTISKYNNTVVFTRYRMKESPLTSQYDIRTSEIQSQTTSMKGDKHQGSSTHNNHINTTNSSSSTMTKERKKKISPKMWLGVGRQPSREKPSMRSSNSIHVALRPSGADMVPGTAFTHRKGISDAVTVSEHYVHMKVFPAQNGWIMNRYINNMFGREKRPFSYNLFMQLCSKGKIKVLRRKDLLSAENALLGCNKEDEKTAVTSPVYRDYNAEENEIDDDDGDDDDDSDDVKGWDKKETLDALGSTVSNKPTVYDIPVDVGESALSKLNIDYKEEKGFRTVVMQWRAPRRPLQAGDVVLIPRSLLKEGSISICLESCGLQNNPSISGSQEPATDVQRSYAAQTFAQELLNKIIYIDDDLIVLNKPPSLAVQGGKRINLHMGSILPHLKLDGKFVPVSLHRLDKPTTGALVLARNPTTAHRASRMWTKSLVQKRYLAILDGVPLNSNGVVEAMIHIDNRGYAQMPIDTWTSQSNISPPKDYANYKNRDAITEFQVLRRSDDGRQSLVLLSAITGRKHQLRVHCAWSLGAPIVGEPTYKSLDGRSSSNSPSDPLQLHSYSIRLRHWFGDQMHLEAVAPIPEHMNTFLLRRGFCKDERDLKNVLDMAAQDKSLTDCVVKKKDLL